ncbi:hypothetical protein KCU93_g3457, partial [Aureobasidium melanogenum]
MDSANNLPQTQDSIMDGLGSSSATRSEVAAQENGQSRLAQSLKNYQSKSPEEVAAILQQWDDVREEYSKKMSVAKEFVSGTARVRQSILYHQASYAVLIKNFPSIIDLGRLSAGRLQSYEEALEHDKKAGEATWALYDIYKKMNASQNAFERCIAFREEHFILGELEQQSLDRCKTSIAIGRFGGRETGLVLMQAREEILKLSDEDD